MVVVLEGFALFVFVLFAVVLLRKALTPVPVTIVDCTPGPPEVFVVKGPPLLKGLEYVVYTAWVMVFVGEVVTGVGIVWVLCGG